MIEANPSAGEQVGSLWAVGCYRARSQRTRFCCCVVVILLLPWVLNACGGGSQSAGQEQGPGGGSGDAVGTPSSAHALAGTNDIQTDPASKPKASPTAPSATATPSAPLAALVNGQPIFLDVYERRVSLEEQIIRGHGIDVDSEQGRAELESVRQELLEQLIDQLLIRQRAEAQGMVISDAEVDARLEADVEAGGGQAAFMAWLQVTGMTLQDYEQLVGDTLVRQQVMDELTAGVPVMAEQVHIRHIVVRTETEAAQILALLQQGHDFGDVAREHSLDLATKVGGGDMGWFPSRLLAPELQRAVAALEPGGISDVVRLGDQFQVLQVLERQPDRPLAPESYAEVKLAVFQEWLETQRAAATVQRYVGE